MGGGTVSMRDAPSPPGTAATGADGPARDDPWGRLAGGAAIGLGCSRLGSTLGGCTGEDAIRLVRHAEAAGVRLFDTADIYGQGDSERLLGAALRGRLDGVVLVTKAGQRFTAAQRLATLAKAPLRRLAAAVPALCAGIARQRAASLPRNYSPGHLRRALEGSLRRLGAARIDLFLLHSPDAAVLQRGEAFAMLDDAVRAGLIGGWGVSCDDVGAAAAALDISQLAALQFPLRLAPALRPCLAAAADRGVLLLPREVMAGAADAAARRTALRTALALPGALPLVGTMSAAHLDDALRLAQPEPAAA